MELPVFDHEGPWTEAALRALMPVAAPEGASRIELADGSLVIGPGRGPARIVAVGRVRDAVSAALPEGLRVIGPVPLRMGPDCVLVPDLLVVRADPDRADPDRADPDADATPEILDAAEALMVIEVVGDEHGITDRSFKPQLYARSRIPYSVLIDHDHPFAAANMIIGGRYHEYAHAQTGQRLVLEEPFHLELDLDAVAARDAPVI